MLVWIIDGSENIETGGCRRRASGIASLAVVCGARSDTLLITENFLYFLKIRGLLRPSGTATISAPFEPST
jgi:hypothetical protein